MSKVHKGKWTKGRQDERSKLRHWNKSFFSNILKHFFGIIYKFVWAQKLTDFKKAFFLYFKDFNFKLFNFKLF